MRFYIFIPTENGVDVAPRDALDRIPANAS